MEARDGIVIVPSRSEAEGIVAMLDAVLLAAPDVDVLVVGEDGPHGTARLVIGHPGCRHRQAAAGLVSREPSPIVATT